MLSLVIETHALRKQFGTQVAVANLTLSVRQGEVFGFLGPNGAGKSTVIKMLLGLVLPTGGAARLLGAPLGDRRARARVGFLPEHFRFHDSLSGREFLRIHGCLYGLRGARLERRIDELLERVNLTGSQHLPLRQFSKGMVQRAGLAQALIGEPELVFLDEPTSGLDPFGCVLVRELIAELRARGTTVFLNSHLLGEVEATCDRVVFMKQGRTVHELSLTQSRPTLDIELRTDRNDGATLEGLRAFGRDIRLEKNTIRLQVSSEEILPEIANWLVTRGIRVYSLSSRRKSLEEYFIELVGRDHGPG